MGWLNRGARRRPRRTAGEPTYDVDRDGPDWSPPRPYWEQWVRKALDRSNRERHDAYPDHERPFDGSFEPEPLPEPEPVPVAPPPKRARVCLLLEDEHGTVVDVLAPWTLDMLDLRRRATQAWIIGELENAMKELDEGQGLAEYALILALIAVVVIVVVAILGSQISTILSTIGHSV